MNNFEHKNFLIITFLIIILSPFVNAKSNRSLEYSECMNHTDGIAMNSQYASCAEDEFLRKEKILNTAYSKIMKGSTKEQQTWLIKGQNAWISYRENWCRLEEQSSFAPGGFANYYYCLLEKTEKQIDAIQDFSFETFN